MSKEQALQYGSRISEESGAWIHVPALENPVNTNPDLREFFDNSNGGSADFWAWNSVSNTVFPPTEGEKGSFSRPSEQEFIWPEISSEDVKRISSVMTESPRFESNYPGIPHLSTPCGVDFRVIKEALAAEPPQWMPDSAANACMQCQTGFKPITCGRHHCRMCGGIFCRNCSTGRCLLPVKFRERNPQRIGSLKPDRLIPDAVLKGARGLAILTVIKAGMMVTYKIGTGLVVARRRDGTWSAPSAIACCGMGWGAQAGGELMDFIIVLRSSKAVKAFGGRLHISIGAGLSAAAGPVGRAAEADVCAGDGGTAACYTYSCSKGAFLGISLEGKVMTTRSDTNHRFYGDPYISSMDILLGSIPRPRAATSLYNALHDLFGKLEGATLS